MTRRRWSMRVGCFVLNDNVKRIITRARVRRVFGGAVLPLSSSCIFISSGSFAACRPSLVFDDPRTAERLRLLQCSSDCSLFLSLSLFFFFFKPTTSRACFPFYVSTHDDRCGVHSLSLKWASVIRCEIRTVQRALLHFRARIRGTSIAII